MEPGFDKEAAKRLLKEREIQKKQHRETERIALLKSTTEYLQHLFHDTPVEAYLVGSITRPYMFHSRSDIDIVLKNFIGDRFELWSQLESAINRDVELILFEQCSFQDHVSKEGYKVV